MNTDPQPWRKGHDLDLDENITDPDTGLWELQLLHFVSDPVR